MPEKEPGRGQVPRVVIATWTIRAPGGSGTARPGYAEAEFRSGKVATLRIDVAGNAPGRP